MTTKELRRAAQLLRRTAREIKGCHSVGRRQWVAGDPVSQKYVDQDRADHDEMLALATKLYAEARHG